MTLLEEFNELKAKKDFIVAKIANDLFSELVNDTPVGNPSSWKINEGRTKLYIPKDYRSGQLKGSWAIKKTLDGWELSNNMLYASIIFAGRDEDEFGIWRGSKQLPDGIEPTIEKYNILLEQELRKL